MQNIDGRVNVVDSSRSRAPTSYAEGVHRQPAQCPDSPRSTTGDTIGCLQACLNIVMILAERLAFWKSVIAVIFLGVLEKEWLGMWGHGMAEVHGWLEESRRHECGHVDVIVTLIRFTAPMLHTKDSLEAKQGTREGEEENALKRGNDKFYRFVLRAR
ncbi:uncharacterized protein LOC119324926 isoform X1 [Triticum dicoccoides]|uniref:uncharacterized protein LOC119324926 isoform X1 n=1 Tax=Triticum dicoccoides TaxID=85692 RepID=UPI001891998D|nr:uncharacterized protein LOC119324926 isoform X1 [Triticum dicoccoides]